MYSELSALHLYYCYVFSTQPGDLIGIQTLHLYKYYFLLHACWTNASLWLQPQEEQMAWKGSFKPKSQGLMELTEEVAEGSKNNILKIHWFNGWDGSVEGVSLWLGVQKNVFGEREWAMQQDMWKKSMQAQSSSRAGITVRRTQGSDSRIMWDAARINAPRRGRWRSDMLLIEEGWRVTLMEGSSSVNATTLESVLSEWH